jgi:hypothetical protein
MMSDDSDFEDTFATTAGKRSATYKNQPKSAKKAKSKKDGKKAAKLPTVKQKKMSTAVSEPLDCKITGVASTFGDFIGKARVQREKSQAAIQETTQAVIENGFLNRDSFGGSGGASSYGEEQGFPTQESLDDVAREFSPEETIASRNKKVHRTKKTMKFLANIVVTQTAQLAELEKVNPFEGALDEGIVYTEENAWSCFKNAIEHLTTFESKVDGGRKDYNTLFQPLFDRMSYEGLGLDVFDGNEGLGTENLSTVLSQKCVEGIMKRAGPGKELKRHDVRALLSYLAYFGIGGATKQACLSKLKSHLNGRLGGTARSSSDTAFNFKVSQDDSPCYATIFEVDGSHSPIEFEQKGIDFVVKTMKHTNCQVSNAKADIVQSMFYYMIIVANPEFNAEEVRLSKKGGLSDADEIIASKLRDKGIGPSNEDLREVLRAAGIMSSDGIRLKSDLVHCTTELLAQQSEADGNMSTTAGQLKRRWSARQR